MKKIFTFYLLFDLIVAGGVLILLEPPKMELAFGAFWFCLSYTVLGLAVFLVLLTLFKTHLSKFVTFMLLLIVLNATVIIFDGSILSWDFLLEMINAKWTEGAWLKLFAHLDFLLSYALVSIDFQRLINSKRHT